MDSTVVMLLTVIVFALGFIGFVLWRIHDAIVHQTLHVIQFQRMIADVLHDGWDDEEKEGEEEIWG